MTGSSNSNASISSPDVVNGERSKELNAAPRPSGGSGSRAVSSGSKTRMVVSLTAPTFADIVTSPSGETSVIGSSWRTTKRTAPGGRGTDMFSLAKGAVVGVGSGVAVAVGVGDAVG